MARDFNGRLIRHDLLGRPIPKREIKRQVLEENKARGCAAENAFVMRSQLDGYEVERTGRGHDFKLRRRDILTGKVTRTEYAEVKSSPTAPVSRLQKKTKKKTKNYRVVREQPWFF
ncbi:MAG: hypothetical protein WC613_04970 [Candidatus Aenigmatarchaeota archaeon]